MTKKKATKHKPEPLRVTMWWSDNGRKVSSLIANEKIEVVTNRDGWILVRERGVYEPVFAVSPDALLGLVLGYAKRHAELKRFYDALDQLRELFTSDVKEQIAAVGERIDDLRIS